MKRSITCCLSLSLFVCLDAQAASPTQWTSFGYDGETWEIEGGSDVTRPANTVLAGASLPASGPNTSTADLSANSDPAPPGPTSICGAYDASSITAAATQGLASDASAPDVTRRGTGWLVGASGAAAWSGPSEACAKVAALPRACEVVEIARRDDWLLVDILVAERRAWVSTRDMRAATVAIAADATDDVQGRDLWVDGINVRLRAGAGTTFTALASLRPGATVRELNRIQHWLAVKDLATGLVGWVYEPLLSEQPRIVSGSASPRRRLSAQAASKDELWVVVQPSVNMRRSPDPSAPVVKRLPRGIEVSALSVDGEWLQVTAPSIEHAGWVRASGLELAHIVAAGAAAFIKHLGIGDAVPQERDARPIRGTGHQ